MSDDTPYQKAKAQKLPYVKIRVDERTAGKETWLEFEGPITPLEATRVLRMIADLCDDEGANLGSVVKSRNGKIV